MKFLLLATFVAFCSASTLVRTRTIFVGDDGSILIKNSFTGRRIEILKPTVVNGQKIIEINITGPKSISKTVEINEGVSGENVIIDPLILILKNYEGPISDSQWDTLLTKVQVAVSQGELIPQIYDLLVGLDLNENNYVWQGLQDGQQVFSQVQQINQQQIQPQFGGVTILGSSQYFQPSTRFINPLLSTILPVNQRSSYNDLLLNQPSVGQIQGIDLPVQFPRFWGKQLFLNNLLNTQHSVGVFSGKQQQIPFTQQEILSQFPNGQQVLIPTEEQIPFDLKQHMFGQVPSRQIVTVTERQQIPLIQRLPLLRQEQNFGFSVLPQVSSNVGQQIEIFGEVPSGQQVGVFTEGQQIPSIQRQSLFGQGQQILNFQQQQIPFTYQQTFGRQIPITQGQQTIFQQQTPLVQWQHLLGQGQQVGIYRTPIPYNQGLSGLFAYFNNQPLYQVGTLQQPVGGQKYINSIQVPQLVY